MAPFSAQALQNGAIGILLAEWKEAISGSELQEELETTLKFLVSPEFFSVSDNRSLVSDTSTVYTTLTDTMSSWSTGMSNLGIVDAIAVDEVVNVMEVRFCNCLQLLSCCLMHAQEPC